MIRCKSSVVTGIRTRALQVSWIESQLLTGDLGSILMQLRLCNIREKVVAPQKVDNSWFWEHRAWLAFSRLHFFQMAALGAWSSLHRTLTTIKIPRCKAWWCCLKVLVTKVVTLDHEILWKQAHKDLYVPRYWTTVCMRKIIKLKVAKYLESQRVRLSWGTEPLYYSV